MSIVEALPAMLSSIPSDWRGTTYRNSNLLGRATFSEGVAKLSTQSKSTPITTEDMSALGISEDYFRVSSNFTTLLELVLAEINSLPVDNVFTFGSTTMPVIAVAMATKQPIDVYSSGSGGGSVFSDSDLDVISKLGVKVTCHEGAPPTTKSTESIVLVHSSTSLCEKSGYDATPLFSSSVDCVVSSHCLFITSTSKIPPGDILVVRKRLSTPITNPMAEEILQTIAGVEVTANKAQPSAEGLERFYGHLQTLSGTPEDKESPPVCFTAGLPASCSLWVELINRGGCDVLMASTAYGGSSQLTDVLVDSVGKDLFTKTTYDVQGAGEMIISIRDRLNKMAQRPNLLPTTVCFSEIPTNPDMKVPDMAELATIITDYTAKTGKDFLLLVDTTFAPNSKVMEKFKQIAPTMNVMTFISMSKSVSRGLTTAGAIVANHTPWTKDLIKGITETSKLLDTNAKPDQLVFLSENHTNVEKRCLDAYQVAKEVGGSLVENVGALNDGFDMKLAFVSEENAANGFTSSTFSFNLPPPKDSNLERNQKLAQDLVDLICEHKELFKPCVSFGQDNGTVYCTVPATSTQGAIKEEDKAKQEVGGVQLTRLSFPPTIDVGKVNEIIGEALKSIYAATMLAK